MGEAQRHKAEQQRRQQIGHKQRVQNIRPASVSAISAKRVQRQNRNPERGKTCQSVNACQNDTRAPQFFPRLQPVKLACRGNQPHQPDHRHAHIFRSGIGVVEPADNHNAREHRRKRPDRRFQHHRHPDPRLRTLQDIGCTQQPYAADIGQNHTPEVALETPHRARINHQPPGNRQNADLHIAVHQRQIEPPPQPRRRRHQHRQRQGQRYIAKQHDRQEGQHGHGREREQRRTGAILAVNPPEAFRQHRHHHGHNGQIERPVAGPQHPRGAPEQFQHHSHQQRESRRHTGTEPRIGPVFPAPPRQQQTAEQRPAQQDRQRRRREIERPAIKRHHPAVMDLSIGQPLQRHHAQHRHQRHEHQIAQRRCAPHPDNRRQHHQRQRAGRQPENPALDQIAQPDQPDRGNKRPARHAGRELGQGHALLPLDHHRAGLRQHRAAMMRQQPPLRQDHRKSRHQQREAQQERHVADPDKQHRRRHIGPDQPQRREPRPAFDTVNRQRHRRNAGEIELQNIGRVTIAPDQKRRRQRAEHPDNRQQRAVEPAQHDRQQSRRRQSGKSHLRPDQTIHQPRRQNPREQRHQPRAGQHRGQEFEAPRLVSGGFAADVFPAADQHRAQHHRARDPHGRRQQPVLDPVLHQKHPREGE